MNLIDNFESYVKGMINEDGIYPYPGMVRKVNDEMEVMAMDIEADHAIRLIRRKGKLPGVSEFVIGIDTYMKAGQGTEYKDALVLFHAQRGKRVRVGVLEYAWNHGDLKVKSINWENHYWIEKYKDLAKSLYLPPLVLM